MEAGHCILCSMAASCVLVADALFTAFTGFLMFFAPDKVANYVFDRQTDGVHWHLVRCVGGQLLAGAFVTIRFRNSNKTAQTSCHILRIIPSIIVLMLIFQCRSVTPELIASEYLDFAKYFCFGALALHIVMLVSSGWPIGTSLLPGSRIGDCLYQLDAIASICIGVAWLTFPKWLLHRQVIISMDESHELCGRVMGALFVTSYAVSAHALHWTSKKDRMVAVDSRVVCCLCILSAQVWSQFAYLDSWSGGHWNCSFLVF
uniref:GpcrRhopsn4 domain-containing protein n=1 Tax=Heterorhabditis bacteriophora TaxID=37862 RepID=A0A1I7X6C0_HETBA